MSSRCRHQSGPPPQYSRGASTADDGYWHPSDYPPRANSIYTDRLPPPPYEPSYRRSETLPAHLSEPVRGRGREGSYHPSEASDLHSDGYGRRLPPYGYDEPRSRRPRRPYSHDRMSERDSHHSRPPPSRHGRQPHDRDGPARSKSVSSSTPRNKKRESTGTPWWQNPIVRTCAITAVSTGLSAALDSRGDPGQWKGAKGAKVAVASVGSALVDGFLGQKHPNSVRQEVVKKGFEVAMDKTEQKKQESPKREKNRESSRRHSDDRHHRRRHSDGSSRGHGRRH